MVMVNTCNFVFSVPNIQCGLYRYSCIYTGNYSAQLFHFVSVRVQVTAEILYYMYVDTLL